MFPSSLEILSCKNIEVHPVGEFFCENIAELVEKSSSRI